MLREKALDFTFTGPLQSYYYGAEFTLTSIDEHKLYVLVTLKDYSSLNLYDVRIIKTNLNRQKKQ